MTFGIHLEYEYVIAFKFPAAFTGGVAQIPSYVLLSSQFHSGNRYRRKVTLRSSRIVCFTFAQVNQSKNKHACAIIFRSATIWHCQQYKQTLLLQRPGFVCFMDTSHHFSEKVSSFFNIIRSFSARNFKFFKFFLGGTLLIKLWCIFFYIPPIYHVLEHFPIITMNYLLSQTLGIYIFFEKKKIVSFYVYLARRTLSSYIHMCAESAHNACTVAYVVL